MSGKKKIVVKKEKFQERGTTRDEEEDFGNLNIYY